MQIAYVDESSYSEADSFTACGLASICTASVPKVTSELKSILKSGGFFDHQALKWTLPAEWKRETDLPRHTEAKSSVLKLCRCSDINLFGYLHLNEPRDRINPERNSKFGLNTLLAAYNRWLNEKDDYSMVVLDRMEWSGAYDYCVEKFGNCILDKPQPDSYL